MIFEYDLVKSNSNRLKHGIDFIDAQLLWQDQNSLEIQARKDLEEPRWALIGMIDSIYWTAIFTMRKEHIRIISVRRSRDEEKDLYHG